MSYATDEPRDAFQSEDTLETTVNEARWYAVQVASGC
jgi:transcriptional antiterminator NusG